MLQISAGVFKAKCLKLMDDVQLRKDMIIITKRGKPVAKLIAFDEMPLSLYGCMAGSVETVGDIVEGTGEKWDAAS